MDLSKKSVRPTLKSVTFNKASGLGEIVISGKLSTIQGVDDPVIEIFNAVQLKKQTAILKTQGKELINFTPFFPSYNEKKDQTIYKLAPTKPAGIPEEYFLEKAEKTLYIFYADSFMAAFRQFLNDENDICNYNGYSLYKVCIERIEGESDNTKKREYDIRTIRMLLEYFINFLDLPLPKSKEETERKAARLSMEFLTSGSWKNSNTAIINFLAPERVKGLIQA